MDIILYELGTARSARCRWTLAEAGVDYTSKEDRALLRSDELRQFHPLGKMPAAIIDGKPLFESAAICTYVADHAPDADLIAAPGSWGRALHDQWTAFILTEVEAWLWNSAVNSFVLPPEERIDAGLEQDKTMARRGLEALNASLDGNDYLVEDRFTVTDIIVAWTVNWARRQELLGGLDPLKAYLARLLDRPHCPLATD